MRKVIMLVLFSTGVLFMLLANYTQDAFLTLYLPPYYMQVSFNLFVMSLVVLLVLYYYVRRFFSSLISIPQRITDYRMLYRQRKSVLDLDRALLAYFQGDYHKAFILLSDLYPQYFDFDALAFILADTAQRLNHMNVYHESIKQLDNKSSSHSQTALSVLKSRHSFYEKEIQQGLSYLENASFQTLGHYDTLNMLIHTYIESNDLETLQNVIDYLRRFNHIDLSRLTLLLKKIITLSSTENQLLQFWKTLSYSEQQSLELSFLEKMTMFQSYKLVHDYIESALVTSWNDQFIILYAYTNAELIDKKIRQLKLWFDKSPQKISLSLALARLYFQKKNWELARQYYERFVHTGYYNDLVLEYLYCISQTDPSRRVDYLLSSCRLPYIKIKTS